MSYGIDWPSWITAISTAITTIAVFASLKISRKLFLFQESTEKKQQPHLHIWINKKPSVFSEKLFTLTICNLGGKPFSLRSIELSGQNGLCDIKIFQDEVVFDQFMRNQCDPDKSFSEHKTDIICEPNQPKLIAYYSKGSDDLIFRATYYDGSTEEVPLNRTRDGGDYILKGQGRGSS